MSLLHHILQPRWNVYYFNNNLKSTEEKHQISAIHKLNGRPKKISSLTHSLTQSSQVTPQCPSPDPILSSAPHFLPRVLSLLQLLPSCAPPVVLGYAFLVLPLWILPLAMHPSGLLSVNNPSPSSLPYVLLYQSLLCLSPEIFLAYSSTSPNPQDVSRALITWALDASASIPWSAAKFQNHTGAQPSHFTQRISSWF